ncbi:hypothetical protein GH714_010118 [Hevea brasiliensis]|uniref:Uncharacterized protein n=1 Tax=Hevea brasiliensis TaxID=3981 RepID=A0A6A6LRZ7_HEVBR|nr:hypothetical protein GH714_010118 [Hevea brasiliensis]
MSESDQCETETSNHCDDKEKALSPKIIAILSILVTSMIGVGAPLFTRSIPALNPERNLFVIVKTFAAGIILATGFMHVLLDSFDILSLSCLKENPWHKFPFTGFVAMLSAIITLMVDSMASNIYSKKCSSVGVDPAESDAVHGDRDMGAVASVGHFHGHFHESEAEAGGQQLLRYRVIAGHEDESTTIGKPFWVDGDRRWLYRVIRVGDEEIGLRGEVVLGDREEGGGVEVGGVRDVLLIGLDKDRGEVRVVKVFGD